MTKKNNQKVISIQNWSRLPKELQSQFKKLSEFRTSTNMRVINHPNNLSTVALLVINNREFWGINKSTAGVSSRLVEDLKTVLKDDNGVSAHRAVLSHAEADAIVDACNKHMNAQTAKMFVDRKLCGFCGGPNLNGGSLRRLLPLLNLQTLKVYCPDETGNIVEVTLQKSFTFKSNTY